MKISNFLLVFSAILFLFSNSLLAQKPDLIFEKIMDNQDKSIGYITDMHQDNDGFIWFAGMNGLCRYDGYELKVFQNDYRDTTSLPFNSIDGYFVDSEGVFRLICRDPGLGYTRDILSFDPNVRGHELEDIASPDLIEPQKIIGDEDGNLWIATYGAGIHKYDRQTGKTFMYCKDYNNYSDELYQIVESIRSNEKELAEIVYVTDFKNERREFSLDKVTPILIISVGEGENGIYDYGSISEKKDTIWKMDFYETKHAGGSLKNRIEIRIDTLGPGTYALNYRSDDSHSYGYWNEPGPDVLDLYGIQLFQIEGELIDQLVALIQREPGENKIASNFVRDLGFTPDGQLLLLSYQGISMFNESSNSFELQEIDFQGMFNTSDASEGPRRMLIEKDICWIITYNNSLIKYNFRNQSYEVFRESAPEWVHFNSIHKNQDGQLLVPNFTSLNIFDTLTSSFYTYKSGENNIYRDVDKMIQDHSGTYWLPSYEGLNIAREKKFKYFLLVRGYQHGTLKHFFVDETNTVWFWAPERRTFCGLNVPSGQMDEHKLEGAEITKVINSNPIWDWISFMYEDSRNNLWLAGLSSMFIFDKEEGRISKNARIEGEEDNRNYILRIYEDSANNLWVFSNSGIYLYDYNTNTLNFHTALNMIDQLAENARSNNIDEIIEGSNNTLWLRTYNGLLEFNTANRSVTKRCSFPDEFYGDFHRGNLHMDDENNLWFATYEKLYKYETGEKELSSFILRDSYKKVEWDPGYRPYIVTDGGDGNLWISIGVGLVKFNKESEEFKIYSKDQGLPGPNLMDYIIDERGMIWLATNEGISRFDPEKEYFTYYKETFYMADDTKLEHQFINRNILTDKSVVFCTTYGMVSFQPGEYNLTQPPVVITGFSLFDKEYQTDTIINRKKVLRLNYKQNFFSFKFAALDYNSSEKNRYMYMLEGLDKEWTNCDAKHRIAKYTKVAPGEYVFRVKGANSDGVWNEEGASLAVIIKPPWYKTILAYIIYAILFIGLLYLSIKIRERKLRLENEQLEKIVAERTEEVHQQKEEIIAQRDDIILQRNLVTDQKEELLVMHQEVTDSINYAKRLQNSAFPDWKIMEEHFSDSFVLFKPKSIVSGDFYWYANVEGQMVVTVADCTGHGVPGAFMSMLGISLLKEIVVNEYITHASVILNRLRKQVIRTLGQTGAAGEQKDGMDISLCSINPETREMQWSGANSPCLIIRDGEIIELKGDNMPIAIYERMDKFQCHEFQLQKDDIIYMASDGYIDQFGGPNSKKFMKKRFKELLLEIAGKPMGEQKTILDTSIEEWKNGQDIEHEQIDDITVMGLKIS